MGGKGSGEQALARTLYPDLEEDWLVIADRNFYSWKDWCAAAGTGAAPPRRVRSGILLPPLELLPDGSYRSVLVKPGISAARRQLLTEAARRGEELDGDLARDARVVEYEVPDRAGDGEDELIALVTTITDFRAAPAAVLARAYHERWEHEGANQQLKTYLRGPGKVLRSQSPAMAEQEIWGYLLTHYAISALICAAAASAGIDPDRVKFKRTVHAIRRAVGPAFPPLSISSASWPTSPGRRTSTPSAGTGPAPAPSNAAGTTITASRNPATGTSATMARPPSGSPTPEKPWPQHDQLS